MTLGLTLEQPDGEPVRAKRRRRRKRSRRRVAVSVSDTGPERVARGLFIACLLFSVLAIGSVHVPTLLVAAVLAIAAAAVAILARESWRPPPPAVLMTGLAAFTVLQSIPLPLGVLSRLAPAATEVWSRSSTLVGEAAPRWASLSLDPGASAVETLKWLAYAATFVTTARVGARRGVRWGAAVLLGAGTIVGLLTLAHGVVDAVKVYGFYEPRAGAERWRIGPLINPNNLAGYMNLAGLAGLGLIAGEAPPLPRSVLGLAVAAVVGVSFTSGSRGGLGALVGGLVLFGMLLRMSPRDTSRKRAFRQVAAPAAIALIGGVTLAIVAANHQSLDPLLQKDLQKFKMIGWIVPILRDHPWFGVGRGAFQTVSPQYFMGPNGVVYTHTENFVTQWMTEWGLPVAVAALVGFAWTLRPARLGYVQTPTASGVFAGFIALLAQNLVDLSLEVPGVAFAAVAAAGFLWGEVDGARAEEGRRTWARVPFVAALCVVGVAATWTAGTRGMRTVVEDRDDAIINAPKVGSPPDDYAVYRDQIRAAMRRHPADAYFPRTEAVAVWQAKQENPLPWMALALERAPRSGRTNYMLGVYLAQHGLRNQALLHLRLAADSESSLATNVASVAIQLSSDSEVLRRAVPEGKAGAPVLSAFALQSLPDSLSAMQDEFLEEAVSRDPTQVEPRKRLVKRLLAPLESPDTAGGRCVGAAFAPCATAVGAHLDALDTLAPDDQEPAILRARLYGALGHPEIAAAKLAVRCRKFKERHLCLGAWLESAASAHDLKMARDAADQLELDGCSGQHRCAETDTRIGDTLTRAGDAATALTYYEKAAREDPAPIRWARAADTATVVADALTQRGDKAGAIRYLERAATEDPNLQRWRAVSTAKEHAAAQGAR